MGVPAAPSSLPTTPQSTQAKRSLLARAIKNNMAQLSINLFNNQLNRSMEDVSMLSNNCNSADVSINTDVSTDTEIDVLNESDVSSDVTPESSPQRTNKRPVVNMDVSMAESGWRPNQCLYRYNIWLFFCSTDRLVDDPEANLCEKCRTMRKPEPETSLMDDSDGDDIESIDDESSQNASNARKRKAAALTNRPAAQQTEQPPTESAKKFKNQVTSTPAALTSADRRRRLVRELEEGMFFGKARHADGKLIRVIYQRKYINDELIGVWVSRDPYSDKSIIDCSLLDQSIVGFEEFAQNLINYLIGVF